MNSIRLLALAACTALATPCFAATFSNSWSFVDPDTKQTVSGVISGLVNGDNLSPDGLIITVTQAPHATNLGTYTENWGTMMGFQAWQNTYSAANGVIVYANFVYTNDDSKFVYFGSDPQNGTWVPEVIGLGEFSYNTEMGTQFSAMATDLPEPASWAMMVGGFGLIGTALRRRRTIISFA